MSNIKRLQQKYPFPTKCPDVKKDPFGWFGEVHEASLGYFINKDTKIILELGSFLGKSTRWMLDNAPDAMVICGDTWLGSVEHHFGKYEVFDKLETMYDTFIKNMWDYKDRIIPIRGTTSTIMGVANYYGVHPDVIYIDAAHDYYSVLADVLTALELFPEAQIIGDDISYHGVKAAIKQVIGAKKVNVSANKQCWWITDKKKIGEELEAHDFDSKGGATEE